MTSLRIPGTSSSLTITIVISALPLARGFGIVMTLLFPACHTLHVMNFNLFLLSFGLGRE